MATMNRTVQGVIHGRSIELDADPGIGDGQRVEVVIAPAPSTAAWGDGIRRSAGIAADLPDFDQAFDQIQQDRELATSREPGE